MIKRRLSALAAVCVAGGCLCFAGGSALGSRLARNGELAVSAEGAHSVSIYLVDPRFGIAQRLLGPDRSGKPASAEWAPDGKRLLVDIGGRQWIADETGARLSSVRMGSTLAWGWGPGDRLIGTAGGGIGILRLDGTLVRLVTRGAEDAGPAWSPDGKRIAFVRPGPGTYDGSIWTVRPDGTKLRRISRGGRTLDNAPSWSPDSSRLVFESRRAGSDRTWLTVSNGDGSGRRALLRSTYALHRPIWSPDGTKIAYRTDYGCRTHHAALAIVGADGRGAACLRIAGLGASDVGGASWQRVP